MISLQGTEAAPLYNQWRPRFAEALTGPLFNIDYLDYLVLGCGLGQLWPGTDAALVTAFKYFPGPTGHHPCVKVIEVIIAAGDADEVVDVLRPAAEEWAREQGCSFVLVESRAGWERILKKHGYDAYQVTLVKEF